MSQREKRKVSVGYFEPYTNTYGLVNQALARGRISHGPLCSRLEEEFATEHDSQYAVLSASGTDSLRAALHAMKLMGGWSDGDEVIVPATTFVATVNIVLQVGMKPVLVDVEPDYYCLDPELIAQAVTKRTRAIIPVNLLGQPADLSRISQIADEYGLFVIEDSCEAMGVMHEGHMVGSWGDVGCFSFYMAHLIAAGVGGVAITQDYEIANLMRSLLNHGRDTSYVSIDDDDDLDSEELELVSRRRFLFQNPGYSSRMTELQAALALPQLDALHSIVQRRRTIAAELTQRLERHSRLQLPAVRPSSEHSYMMYGIVVKTGRKWPLIHALETNDIETRELLPLVNQPVYEGMVDPTYFPVSNKLVESGFYIGCHQGMTLEDVEYVASVVDEYYE